MILQHIQFKDINLDDPFFDSLRAEYEEFPAWFAKKAEDRAYVCHDAAGAVDGFLYLKMEDEEVDDVTPPLPAANRLKVGTFKINPHGTRLGERFLKKIFDHAIARGVEEIYVTVFEKHEKLVELFARYGFGQRATKTSPNGSELVLVRVVREAEGSILHRYPLVSLEGARAYLLALYPKWHTRLLPDSILRSEDARIVEDVSHTNSIHKVYLTAIRGVEVVKPGDVLVIYRTTDNPGFARYRSVATSLCVVEEYRHIDDFPTIEAFLAYCRPYSVFSDDELRDLWRRRKYPKIIRFTYNIALNRRPTRDRLINDVGIPKDAYSGFMPIDHHQLRKIASLGEIDESLVVDQA